MSWLEEAENPLNDNQRYLIAATMLHRVLIENLFGMSLTSPNRLIAKPGLSVQTTYFLLWISSLMTATKSQLNSMITTNAMVVSCNFRLGKGQTTDTFSQAVDQLLQKHSSNSFTSITKRLMATGPQQQKGKAEAYLTIEFEEADAEVILPEIFGENLF